jgi:arylsulfatase A-like enzyme
MPDDPRHGAYYRGVLTRNGKGDQHRDQDTAWVLAAIDMIKNSSNDRPFCCYLPLEKPHPPYYAEEDYYKDIDPDRLPPRIPTPGAGANLPEILDSLRSEYRSDKITEEMWRDVKRIYYAMCTKVDALFGKVVEALVEKGIYDDTWILFFSDHGDFTGDYSLPEKTHSTLQDCLLRVPLIIKPPADVPVKQGNRRHLTELVDITATLYDFLNIEPGYAHQGVSLRGSLAGDETMVHDAVFAEVGSRKNEEGFVNTDVLKMPPDSFYARQGRAAIPYHESGSYAIMCRTMQYKYIRRCYTGHHELFNMEEDPGETRNLSGNPGYADVECGMETRLLDHLMLTADVLPYEPDPRNI